jgi:phytol kinase
MLMLYQFWSANFPTGREFLWWGVPFGGWAFACLALAGYLKRARCWPTGYTRKVFHLAIFTSVALIQAIWGLRRVCLFGAMASCVLAYALYRGAQHPLYEALARAKDAPHRTYYIIIPYCATLLGGVLNNIWFGDLALVGYLVAGLGDAIGEPVGTRFGQHTYRVPALRGVPAIRSYEGSLAVFLMSGVAIGLACVLSPALRFSSQTMRIIPVVALISAVLEAISPHGWDNAVLQLAPSACITLWLALC